MREVEVEHPNAAAVRQFLTAWFQGDFESWGRLAAPDILIHMRGETNAQRFVPRT